VVSYLALQRPLPRPRLVVLVEPNQGIFTLGKQLPIRNRIVLPRLALIQTQVGMSRSCATSAERESRIARQFLQHALQTWHGHELTLTSAQDFVNVSCGGEAVTRNDDFGCGGDFEVVCFEEFEIVWFWKFNVAGIDIVGILKDAATGRRGGR
jgi:hypothetical protein